METESSQKKEQGANRTDEQDDTQDIVADLDFTTLELTLAEARRQYDDEERRRESVENKIAVVVTVDALLISFGAAFVQILPTLLLVLALLPALYSAGVGLYTTRAQRYEKPGKEILDFHDYSNYSDESAQREQLLLDYEVTINDNMETNNSKFDAFNLCSYLTYCSLLVIILILVISRF